MALQVDTRELSTIPSSLRTKKEEILRLYNAQVKNILETSKDAIIVSGLDFNEFDAFFNKAFMNLATELDNLANALQNKILPRYDNLGASIRNSFNNEFASQMQSIINALK